MNSMVQKLKEINEMPLNILIISGGIFCIVCSIMNYNWFLRSVRSWPIVMLLGRGGARFFYFLLGISMLFLGISAAFY